MLKPMSNIISLAQAADLITAAQSIAVFTHENPDGDAIGSSTGLTLLLREAGKKCDLFFSSEPPAIYRPFITAEYSTSLSQEELVSNYDLVIQLDTANTKRIAAPHGVIIDAELPLLVIDHHVDNQQYGRWNVIKEKTATAGIIAELTDILAPGHKISQQVATLLMLGLVTDSGCFRFDNTNPEAFHTAGKLLEAGAAYKEIIERIFFSKPLNRLKFESELLSNHLELYCNGKVALVKIPSEIIAKYDIIMADTEGLIDVFRAIDGVEITIMMYYRANGMLKISTRASNPEHPVGPIARALGGGGHEMAAGCLLPDGDMDATAAKIIDLIREKYQL